MPINEEQFEQSLNFLIANALNKALTLGLSDNLGGKVIHLNSSIPRTLNLSIANELTEEVLIVGQAGRPTPSNYHFLIQFVSNQCFRSSRLPTLTTPNWHMAVNPGDFITHIYLLSTETITLRPSISKIESSISTNVQLQYVGAVLKNVADEVLQVAVAVGKHVYAKVDNIDKPVTGAETVHLTTFTDANVPTPLIATLVQPRTVLNDGTTAPLLLRLVNTSPDPVTFAPPPAANGPTPTAVQLSVDLDEAAAWALCKSDEAGSIVVAHPDNWTGDPAGVIGTGRKTWLFRPDYSKTTQIAPNSALEFPISGVKTTLPPGLTNLYVTLQEFPNYGTQTAVTQIEKSPLIYNKGLGSGLLSSGATGSNQGMTLNGNTTADLLLVNQSETTGKSAHFKGGAGVSIENNLDVTGDVRINDHTLWFRQGSDKNNGIGFRGNNPFAGVNVNGPVVFGNEGGALGSTVGGEKIALSWKNTGNVGIGTGVSGPAARLHVGSGAIQIGTAEDAITLIDSSITHKYGDQEYPRYTINRDLLGNGNAGIGFGTGGESIQTSGSAVGIPTFNALAFYTSGGSNLAERVRIDSFGNVGIGTNQPKSTLSVKGGAAIGSTYANSVAAPDGLIVEGNVGIGTPSPKQKLEVAGNIKMSGTRTKLFYQGDDPTSHVGSLAFYSPDGGKTAIITPYDGVGDELSKSTVRLGGFGNFDSNVVSLAVSGNVGIGTNNPTKAALEVRSGAYPVEITANFGLVNERGCYPWPQYLPDKRTISIYAESVLWCNSWVIASSDERIKRVQGLSDGAEDLNKLLSIEVIDYSYIDALSNGTDTHKKVIAQQVLKVFPQAVSQATNVVPDIYQQAAIHDGWVQLSTNLKKGERVRLIGEKNEGIHEVLEVTDGQFRTDFATEGQQVFVYGREVDDFLNVDYDAIAMLNVSATQQIKREKDAEVQALREENAALRARLDRLENVIKSLVSPGSLLGSDPLEENAPLKLMI